MLKDFIMIKKLKYFFFCLVNKHGVSEYSFCLQYLMQANVISDVESIIQKALSLERISKPHLLSSFDSQSMYNRPIIKEPQKLNPPIPNESYNPLIASTRSNSTSSLLASSRDSEMAV
jgi:hypothetical protein